MKKVIVLALVLVSLAAMSGVAAAGPWGSIWPTKTSVNGSINPL